MGKRVGQWLLWIGIGSQLLPALGIAVPLRALFGNGQAVVGVLMSVLGGFLVGLNAVKARAPSAAGQGPAVPPAVPKTSSTPTIPDTPPAPAPRAPAVAKSHYRVVLLSAGLRKIQVVREVRALTGLGLIEVIDLVDDAPPTVLKDKVPAREARAFKERLEALGASVELQ
ncbi:ribosomal protein L7/L12 [Neisseriaceae bacterium JH1-16]|nr:ribosomal protein L7/L12 [Neisseriaceae bacterium JH1-16]